MHRGLPLEGFIKSVSVSSSESGFGTSVNSTMFVGLQLVHSWISGSRSSLLIFRNVDLDFRSILVVNLNFGNVSVWFLDKFVRSVD